MLYCSAQAMSSLLASCTAGRYSIVLQKLLIMGRQAMHRDMYTPTEAWQKHICPFCTPCRCSDVIQELLRPGGLLSLPYASSGLPAGLHVAPKLLSTGPLQNHVHRLHCLQVLELVQELLSTGRQATQRDLYYRLLCPPIFNSTADVHGAIQVSSTCNSCRLQVCETVAGALPCALLCPHCDNLRPRAVCCPQRWGTEQLSR